MSTDLALIAADPSAIEQAADPGAFIVEACDRARTWLREALDHGDIDQIAELKSQAEAVRVYTVSKQYGEDARVAATEIVRRAERGIGVAVRKGQTAGELRRPDQNGGPRQDYMRNGQQVHAGQRDPVRDENRVSPKDYTGSGQVQSDIYAMTDDVSEEQFEEIIEDARAEGNLSRANVARKARQAKGRKARAQVPSRKRKPLADVLLHCVIQLQGTVERIDLELEDGLDESVTPELAGEWADDLTGVIRPLTRLRSLLKEKANG